MQFTLDKVYYGWYVLFIHNHSSYLDFETN